MEDLPKLVQLSWEMNTFLSAYARQIKNEGYNNFLMDQMNCMILRGVNCDEHSIARNFLCLISTRRITKGHVDSGALYSKSGIKDKCTLCGNKWHPTDKCWEKIGYPAWHSKHKLSCLAF